MQRIVKRPHVGIDFFLQRAGQKAEPLARLHSRPRQNIRFTCFESSAETAMATARYVLPVPPGPMANTMS